MQLGEVVMEMQIAHYWAHVFGPFLVLVGLWMVLYTDNVVKIMASIKSSPACFHILGLLQLLMGLILVTQCNVWVVSRVVFVTLLGWFFLFRGILSLFFPQVLMKWLAKGKIARWAGLVPLIWGLLLYWAILT